MDALTRFLLCLETVYLDPNGVRSRAVGELTILGRTIEDAELGAFLDARAQAVPASHRIKSLLANLAVR